jgi:hypothetical protein
MFLQVKDQGKTPLTKEQHLNNEGQECKVGRALEKGLVGRRVNKEGKGG